MKRLLTIYVTFLFLLYGTIIYAQSDTTSVGSDASDVVNGIFKILEAMGFPVNGYQPIAALVVVFLVKWIVSKRLRSKHAQEIQKVIDSAPTIKAEHASLFKNLIDRLEGKKQKNG